MSRSRALAALLIAFPAALLMACGGRPDTQKHVDKGNANLQRMRQIEAELASRQIYLGRSYDAQGFRRACMSIERAEPVQRLLSEFVSLGDELSRIVDRDDVIYAQKAEAKALTASAKQILSALTSHLASLGSNPEASRALSQGACTGLEEDAPPRRAPDGPPARKRPGDSPGRRPS